MIISTLVENYSVSENFTAVHGLSIHIKTADHSILFDLGPDDTFLHNVKKLGINKSEVDLVVISHGHKDHGGGLKTFLDNNKKAKIYINKNAFDKHYASFTRFLKFYIGLDENLKDDSRIILTEDVFQIDESLTVFSNVRGTKLLPSGNKNLLVKKDGKYVRDDFKHEQNLLIKEEGKISLVSGCSHCGVLNILEKAEGICGSKIDLIIGGFHLYNPIKRKTDSKEIIRNIADELLIKDLKILTCHCTGLKGFEVLKEKLKDSIEKISTGTVIKI